MALGIDCVFPVGVMGPDFIGKEFKLGKRRPVFDILLVLVMLPENFLEEDQIRMDLPNRLPDITEHKTTIAGRKALVDVVGEDFQRSSWHTVLNGLVGALKSCSGVCA